MQFLYTRYFLNKVFVVLTSFKKQENFHSNVLIDKVFLWRPLWITSVCLATGVEALAQEEGRVAGAPSLETHWPSPRNEQRIRETQTNCLNRKAMCIYLLTAHFKLYFNKCDSLVYKLAAYLFKLLILILEFTYISKSQKIFMN